MNYGIKGKRWEAEIPLVVKEVILPCNSTSTDNPRQSSRNNFLDDYLEETDEGGAGNTESGSVKIGEHEIKCIKNLISLEKKPLENYFQGTKKKERKLSSKTNKDKDKRIIYSLEDLVSGELQTASNVSTPDKWSPKPLKQEELSTIEQSVQQKLIQRKIYRYDKMKQQKQQSMSRRQRLAEENYIEQQENLAETWIGIINRKNQLKDLDQDHPLNYPKPICSKNDRSVIKISIISKKFWNYEDGSLAQKKKEEVPQDQTTSIELEENFEKLVFVDVDDSDEEDYSKKSSLSRRAKK